MFIQDPEDKRNAVRVNFVADVTVNLGQDDRAINGRLQNLSIDGMSLQTPETAVPPNTPCSLAIIVRDRHSKLIIDEIAGEVVRSDGEEMAIRFLHHFEWLALFHVYHSKSAGN